MLWHCRQCSAAYAAELPACPQCGSTDYDVPGTEAPRKGRKGSTTARPDNGQA